MGAPKAFAAAALSALFLPSAALASGYYVPDLGTVARSRGGAFAVAADDPTAIAYNPAGLAGQKRGVLVDITSLWLAETFKRSSADVPADGQSAPGTSTNNPPPQISPQLIYVNPIGDRMAIAAGLHAPDGARYQFAKNGRQRYTNTSLYNTEAAFGVAFAYKVMPNLSVGLELENMIHGVQQDFVATRGQGTDPGTEAAANDDATTLDVMDPSTPNAILGVKYAPIQTIELGFSFRPGQKVDAAGTLKDQVAGSQKVHFHFTVPMILRLGARYVQPKWDVESDFVYEGWSTHDKETLTADSGTFVPFGGGTQTQGREFTDGWSLRVGGGYQAMEKLKVLGGIYYETSAVPDQRLDVGTFDSAKEGLCAGVSYDVMPHLTVDFNVAHTLMASRTISNSKNRQQNGSPTPDPNLTTISNGSYSGSYNFVGLAFLAKF
jgi:long-chain fatty acid transport protein